MLCNLHFLHLNTILCLKVIISIWFFILITKVFSAVSTCIEIFSTVAGWINRVLWQYFGTFTAVTNCTETSIKWSHLQNSHFPITSTLLKCSFIKLLKISRQQSAPYITRLYSLSRVIVVEVLFSNMLQLLFRLEMKL